MLNKLFGAFSQDIGIDLGTANTLVYTKSKGIVINEPSVVALNTKTDQVLAIGNDAKRMVGKTPAHIVANRPLSDGVVSDFEEYQLRIRYAARLQHRLCHKRSVRSAPGRRPLRRVSATCSLCGLALFYIDSVAVLQREAIVPNRSPGICQSIFTARICRSLSRSSLQNPRYSQWRRYDNFSSKT